MTLNSYSVSHIHKVQPAQREAAARLHPKPLSHTGEACPELVEGGFEKYLTNPPNRYNS
ncbi:hypothetical protein NIES39_A01890 [Arthrospira platensis NIES-39]|nr:hypothetical protein NIES39_A01890 [Arthrospira platensis NIES-39]